MTVNMQDVLFMTEFSGLGNNQSLDFSVTVPAQTVPANGSVIYTASGVINTPGSISEVQIRYTGRDSLWYWLDGFHSFTDPSNNFLISTRTYFENNTIYVTNFILDLTGSDLALPSFTVDCRAFLYTAPW